ncbi:MAG: hypothetical protein WDZ59_04635 [Pirellulales bacterium]
MTEPTLDQRLADLWDAVLNLSLPADDQLLILEASGDRRAIDELALSLEDVFWVAQEAFSQNRLSRQELDALGELNASLDSISGRQNAHSWTPEALQSHECWRRIRQLAADALTKRQVSRIQTGA